MADAQKTIDLIFNGVDKTGAATMAALDNARKFSSSLQSVTAPIADFTAGAVKIEAGLLAAGVAMTVFAVKTAGDFDAAFRQISTIIDASDEDLAGFKAAILDYAQGSTQPLEDISAALSAAIGSGVDWAKSLDLIGVAEKLAVATRADLKSTTETLVGTLNAYGMKTEDAGKVSDLFFQIIKDGKIEMTDLSASFANVTSIAPQAGVSLVDLGAAIATLTATSMQPSTAIDALKSAISNIIKPSKQAQEMAASLGIEFDANALKSKGFAGVLDDVSKATGGSADKLSILFGDVTGLGAVMLLTGTQADKFKDSIASMGDSAGAVNEAFEKMSGSLDVSLGKVANTFKILLISIGAPLLDEFGGIASAIANIFTALATSVKSGALKDLVAYIESVFGDIQGALEAVAKNLPAALASADFRGFQNGIEAVLEAVTSLFGGLDLTSVQGLKDAIELVGVAFLGLSKYVAGSIEVFGPLFDTLVAVGKGAQDVDLSFLELAGNLGGIATQLNVVLPLFTGLLTILAAKQSLSLITDLGTLTGLMGGASTAAGTLATALGKAGLVGAAGAAGYAVGGLVNDGISALLSAITGSDTTLGSFIYDLTHTAEKATEAGAGTAQAAKGVKELGAAAAGVEDDFSAANQAMLDNFAASEKAATATGALATAQKDVSKYALETVPIYDKLTGAIIGYEQVLKKSATGTIDLGRASDTANAAMAKTNEVMRTSGDVMDALSKKTDLTNKDLIELAKVTKEAEIKLEGIASNERIKLIESKVKLDIANVEANAKIAVSLIEGLANTITSTGDVLGGLYGSVKDFNSLSWSSEALIKKGIETESKLRQDAFDLQKKLTEAQIEQMKAQTQALNKGDGLIKIEGDGLKPHLEAFMWEILKAIQIKVNKDGLKMLLGA